MNNFTKEELQFIAIALNGFAVKDCDLNDKIKSMIDNYDKSHVLVRGDKRELSEFVDE